MKKYNYTFDFTANTRNKIVIRFYYKNDLDKSLGLRSISNIIPGGFTDKNDDVYDYYDSSGRKVAAQGTEDS